MFDKLSEILNKKEVKMIITVISALSIFYRLYSTFLEVNYYKGATKSLQGANYDSDIAKENVFNYIGQYETDLSDEQVLTTVNQLFENSKSTL